MQESTLKSYFQFIQHIEPESSCIESRLSVHYNMASRGNITLPNETASI